MALARRSIGDVDVFTFGERLDAAGANPVRDQIRTAIQDGARRIVLDLGPVTFIDSSGLFALVAAFKQARSVGGDTVLLGLSPAVRSVIELTRLHRVFEIFDDEATAVAALRSSPID
ncbi:MAG: STAS domain-containing protein [Vicinamibacteria bacterium]